MFLFPKILSTTKFNLEWFIWLISEDQNAIESNFSLITQCLHMLRNGILFSKHNIWIHVHTLTPRYEMIRFLVTRKLREASNEGRRNVVTKCDIGKLFHRLIMSSITPDHARQPPLPTNVSTKDWHNYSPHTKNDNKQLYHYPGTCIFVSVHSLKCHCNIRISFMKHKFILLSK